LHNHILVFLIFSILNSEYLNLFNRFKLAELLNKLSITDLLFNERKIFNFQINRVLFKGKSYYLGRHLEKSYPKIVKGKGNYLYTEDGRKILDASSGVAVSCLGHGNKKIIKAMINQLKSGIPYLASVFWSNNVIEELCSKLIESTKGKMGKVYLTGSGSEATEAAIKLARQYYYEQDKNTSRINFIVRKGSYHGNTIGALSVSGHELRRIPYIPFLMKNVHFISSCNPYRQQLNNESNNQFIEKKVAELEKKFKELGPNTVIGLILEPVVGAALGCVPYVPGYLKSMKEVCHKYGALFIVDEVMCGIGRTGTLHAWQKENTIPDIQILGKGLGAGYQSIAAIMASQKIIDVLKKGSKSFIHGHTYQGMPIQAAVALEVLRTIEEKNLLDNVIKLGDYLETSLKIMLDHHPNVGNIRGSGLFWGIEFVKNKDNKEPFDIKYNIAQEIVSLAISSKFNMTIYPGTGTYDGIKGDHIIIAPPFTITKKEIDYIVNALLLIINEVFNKINVKK